MTKRFKYKINLTYLINKIGEENGNNNRNGKNKLKRADFDTCRH